MFLKYFIVTVFFLVLPVSARAEEKVSWRLNLNPSQSSYETMREMKEKIHALTEENERLRAEHDRLVRRHQHTRDEVAELRRNVDNMPQEPLRKSIPEQPSGFLNTDPKILENEILLKKSRLGFLSSQLIDLEEKQRTWSLKVNDMKYQKRELLVRLKMKELETKEEALEQDEHTQSLRTKLKRNLERQKELDAMVDELKDLAKNAPRYVPSLKQENADLLAKIEEYRIRRDYKEKVIEHLKTRKQFEEASHEGTLEDKEKERLKLLHAVQSLEKKYETLDQRVRGTLSKKKKQESLYHQVINVDRENQTLREQIAELEEKLLIQE